MVTKTIEELDAMSPEEKRAHYASEEKIVFGTDFRKKNGAPIEQGIGAPGRESENHFKAIGKYEGAEAEKAARTAAAGNKKRSKGA